MKLAPFTLSIVHRGAGGHAGAQPCHPNAIILRWSDFVRPPRVRRHAGNLVARWQVSRQTGQLECHWSLDGHPTDDHLWRRPYRTMRCRHWRLQQRLRSRCHKPVTEPMSFRFDDHSIRLASA